MSVNLGETSLKGAEFIGALSQSPSLSKNQSDILRKIVSDATFRQHFYTDPVKAVGKADLPISAQELAVLARLTPGQYDAIGSAIKNIAADGDGTHTLAYAIAFAVVLALVMAMPEAALANQFEAGMRNKFGAAANAGREFEGREGGM